jgi:hypothetical protein
MVRVRKAVGEVPILPIALASIPINSMRARKTAYGLPSSFQDYRMYRYVAPVTARKFVAEYRAEGIRYTLE